MATLTKEFFSSSSNGLPIKITSTSTAGNAIHTVPAGTTGRDEIWLYATNTGSTNVKLTVEFGDTTAPDHNITVTVPSTSNMLVIPGIPLDNAKAVTAFAGTANVLNVFGFINRLT